MIQVHQLVKWYGPTLAVDHIDLEVGRGQIVGFLGPNGAGKTTTLRILTGFIPATAGKATINGYDVFKQSRSARGSVGYLPESTPLYPELRVDEQLHYFGQLQGMARRDRVRRIDELTERCGLGRIRRRLVGQLSKGNKQRVGLAQALLHDPPVLILDEPTVGLDPMQITEVRKLIVSLAGNKTVLLSTHILPEVEKTCQQVVIINRGRIVAQGSPAQLKAQVRSQSRVLLEVEADGERVKPMLLQLPQVREVATNQAESWCTAAVTPAEQGQDIRQLLVQAVQTQGWPLREIRPEAASLEEFFIQITAAG